MLHITLNDTQVAELRQLARQALGRVSERAHFVLLSHQGYSPPEIGRLMGYDAATVRAWLKDYQARQCAGLADAPRSGRPAKEPAWVAIVQAQASQSPPTRGYLQACWTVALLVLHLCQRLRIYVSPTTVRRALHAAGLAWKRPKLAPAHRPDPQAAEKEAKLAEILGDAEGTIIAEDEADVHLLAVVRSMWQRRGEQQRIPTPGQNAKRSVFGGLNVRTGEWFYHITARKRGMEFIAFLTALLTAYSAGTLYVIVDNASIHTSRAAKHWLTLHTHVQLVYLPTYSGHRLNPVEKVWWDLKDDIAANRCFKSLVELEQAVHRYFVAFTKERALGLTNCKVTRTAQQALAKK